MNRIFQRIQDYLYNVEVDINERLGTFFVNIGILAAIFGVVVCLLAHTPVAGTISSALIAVTAPLIASITRHTEHPERYGSIIGILIIFMIPIVWLNTGAETGGTGYWFVYELFYITLFTKKKQLPPFIIAAVLVIAAVVEIDWRFPDLFFHFSDRRDALVCKLGSCTVVTVEILITVFVQKSLYTHERSINTKTQDQTRSFVMSIANTLDTKDPYTGGHSRRVAECAAALALRLGMSQPEADNIYFVALLHDIGKIGVPDRILNKPGRLTDEEAALIRKHPVYGADILKDITMIPHVRDGVLYHHEHYDGTGYPEGLKGEEIPFIARIIAVADSYDAMSTNRVYRKYIPRDEIINELIRCSGTQFDPYIVDVFVKMLMEGFQIESAKPDNNSSMESNLEVAASTMMRRIIEDTQLLDQKSGTINVDNEDYSNLYAYLLNLSRQHGITLLLVTISLSTAKPDIKQEYLLSYMDDLNKAITRNIRSVDICTRNGPTSYWVLLLNAPGDSVEPIVDRIRTVFFHLHGSNDVSISYRIPETGLQAETHADLEILPET